jgi:RIO kinase 1
MSLNLTLDEVLRQSLETYLDKGLITDVLSVLKSGKEATVYCCRGGDRIGGRLLAVKVYRPLEHRHFRNDSAYREGRVILSGRVRRAVSNRSDFGKEAAFGMWYGMEAAYLRELHGWGLDVPRVIDSEGNSIVMEFLGDESGAAPQLRSVRLTELQAQTVWKRTVWSVTRMLSHNRIHGDLSPYNLLWHHNHAWIIDVPQMIDPRENPNARTMLERDLENVHRYLTRFTELPDPWKLAGGLWYRWKESTLPDH